MEKPLHIATPGGEAKKPAAAKPSGAAAADSQEPHVTWDEETIARHDLERGTRMKIDEPDTPYHYYAGSDMQAEDLGSVSPARSLSGKEGKQSIEWDELQEKLQNVKDAKKSEWDSSDDECSSVSSASSGRRAGGGGGGGIVFAERDAEGKKIHKDPKFAEKRKMHYNEFERVRAWKMQHANEDDDEDEDKAPATSAVAKASQ